MGAAYLLATSDHLDRRLNGMCTLQGASAILLVLVLVLVLVAARSRKPAIIGTQDKPVCPFRRMPPHETLRQRGSIEVRR